jgi:hypothetical protein
MNDSQKEKQGDAPQQIPPISGEKPTVPQACCKVQRVAEAYYLSGVNDELRRRYEASDATLHELADYVNDRITAITLDSIDEPIDAEPATVRAALTEAKDIPPTRRDDIRATLVGQIDVDQLINSYVSHETIRRHLNEHLDISTSQGGFNSFEELKDSLNAYQEQYENGVRSALERANKKELIDGGEYLIFSTRVECQHCSETYRLQELLDNRGCDCQSQD